MGSRRQHLLRAFDDGMPPDAEGRRRQMTDPRGFRRRPSAGRIDELTPGNERLLDQGIVSGASAPPSPGTTAGRGFGEADRGQNLQRMESAIRRKCFKSRWRWILLMKIDAPVPRRRDRCEELGESRTAGTAGAITGNRRIRDRSESLESNPALVPSRSSMSEDLPAHRTPPGRPLDRIAAGSRPCGRTTPSIHQAPRLDLPRLGAGVWRQSHETAWLPYAGQFAPDHSGLRRPRFRMPCPPRAMPPPQVFRSNPPAFTAGRISRATR